MSRPELSKEPVELIVDAADAGKRLDAFLAQHFVDYSRVHLRRVITAGGVRIDDTQGGKPSYRLRPGQRVAIVLPEIPREAPSPEDIPLEILYQDEHVAAVNKPPGMVVHPARGNWSGTLASALQHHFNQLSTVGGPCRPGIVHRLDRDTSGIILVACNDRAHAKLASQFESRTIEKEYFALVAGQIDRDRDLIDRRIGVHPHVREKMAIRQDESISRPAQTFYEVIERFDGFASVRLLPKTGRTHQLRVHMDHIGCPILCDRQYGGRSCITRGEIRRVKDDDLVLLERQALHARSLKFTHPETGQPMELEAPLPNDINAALSELRAYRS